MHILDLQDFVQFGLNLIGESALLNVACDDFGCSSNFDGFGKTFDFRYDNRVFLDVDDTFIGVLSQNGISVRRHFVPEINDM